MPGRVRPYVAGPVLAVLLLAGLARAESSEAMKAMPSWTSAEFQLETFEGFDLQDPAQRSAVAFLAAWLSNTYEVSIHQMRGQTGNKVYLHADGHREAVVDAEGKPVTDCVNQASYNYYTPRTEALQHFVFDTLPWLLLGNCKEDPTSLEERTAAYLLDLRAAYGQTIAAAQTFELPAQASFGRPGEKQALAFFLKCASLSGLTLPPAPGASPDAAEPFLAKFSAGLLSLLQSAAGKTPPGITPARSE